MSATTAAATSSPPFAGIGRLVAAAQAREAPVQRVADAVAGKFCYGVMAASAATFTFWQTLGTSHASPWLRLCVCTCCWACEVMLLSRSVCVCVATQAR